MAGWDFARTELRCSRSVRELSPGCGCLIGPRELYRYFVGKATGLTGIIQTYACDHCMRSDSSY